MKSIKIIMLIAVVVPAKCHKKYYENIFNTKYNLFHKINEHIHNLTNSIFEYLLISEAFPELSKITPYLSMHYNLNRISEKNYDIYDDMRNASKADIDKIAIKQFFNISDVLQEILREEFFKQPDIAIKDGAVSSTEYAIATENGTDNKNISFDFDNSKELNQFLKDFMTKINKLSVNDLFENPLNSRDNEEMLWLKSDMKVWRPSQLEEAQLNNNTRRIYKGKKTEIKKYPFMASVHILGQLTCAGSIISQDLVLTAASCLQRLYNTKFFQENPGCLTVRVGSNYALRGGDLIEATEINFNPNYNPKTLSHNLVIIRIDRHMPPRLRKKNVKRIILDEKDFPLASSENVVVLGWGAKDKRYIVGFKPTLSEGSLNLYPQSDCQDIYSRHYVTDKHFCAGFVSKGGGACNKDVGGAGVVGGILIGVVSFGPPVCGTLDAPTVFTKVSLYVAWIKHIMKKKQTQHRDSTKLQSEPLSQTPTTATTLPAGLISPIIKKIRFKLSLMPRIETVLLRQAIKDFLFGKEKEHGQLIYDLPDWAEDDLSEMFTTKQPDSAIIADGILYPSLESNEEIFTTTEKENFMEHPLINKSLVFIPEMYGINTTPNISHDLPMLTTAWKPVRIRAPLRTKNTKSKNKHSKSVDIDSKNQNVSDSDYKEQSDIEAYLDSEIQINHSEEESDVPTSETKIDVKYSERSKYKDTVDIFGELYKRVIVKDIPQKPTAVGDIIEAIKNHNWDSKQIMLLLNRFFDAKNDAEQRKYINESLIDTESSNQIEQDTHAETKQPTFDYETDYKHTKFDADSSSD